MEITLKISDKTESAAANISASQPYSAKITYNGEITEQHLKVVDTLISELTKNEIIKDVIEFSTHRQSV